MLTAVLPVDLFVAFFLLQWLASVEHGMWLSRQDLFDQYLEPLMR